MKRTDCAALFDLDGVLIDTESLYTIFWADIDRKYPTGIPDFAAAIKGTNLKSILLHFPESLRGEIVEAIHNWEHTMPYAFYPGAEQLLRDLRAAGVPIAIVTSSDSVKMECLYRQIPQFPAMVDVIVNGSMVTNGKPDPEGYLKGAELLGVAPECATVVEDSLQGLEAGRRAGGRVLGIATTNPREAVERMADKTVATVAELRVEDFF